LVVILWWIGNLALLFVVAPVCIILLNNLLKPAKEIKAYARDVLEHGVALTGTLDDVPKLVRTKELTGQARQAAGRYVGALQRLM